MLWLFAFLLQVPPIDIADQKQLFIDRRFISDSDRVELHTNEAQKLGLILDEDGNPFQGHISTVIDHDDKVRIVRQRLDGFVSADVDHRGGYLRTPPLLFKGNALRLNIDTGSMGTAFVELQDEDGHPIPSFSMSDCEEIGGNFIDQRVYWKGSSDVSSLAGKAIRLRLNL